MRQTEREQEGHDRGIWMLSATGDWVSQGGCACIIALGHMPAIGESFDRQGWRFEVIDLDGRRIDKIQARRIGAGRRQTAV